MARSSSRGAPGARAPAPAIHSKTRTRRRNPKPLHPPPQMSQLLKRQQRITDMQTRATKAGAKMVPEQPRTANKTRPGVAPAPGWRYR